MQSDGVQGTRAEVVAALQKASAATGSDFNYLFNTAMRESSLKPQAQSSSSSATGLFQFIDQTWLGLVKEHGAQFGLGDYAKNISRSADGRYRVASSADRKEILDLRKDAQTSAYMEGVFSQDQRAKLQSGLGRDVCGGELYAAHFLGTGAACKLIQLAQSAPGTSAAHEFPQAASANRSVFYNSNGSAKTVREVYDWALKNHGDAPIPSTTSVTAAPDAPETTRQIYDPGNSDDDARLANYEFQMLAPSWMSSAGQDDSSSPVPSPLQMNAGVFDLLSTMSPANAVAPVAPKRTPS